MKCPKIVLIPFDRSWHSSYNFSMLEKMFLVGLDGDGFIEPRANANDELQQFQMLLVENGDE